MPTRKVSMTATGIWIIDYDQDGNGPIGSCPCCCQYFLNEKEAIKCAEVLDKFYPLDEITTRTIAKLP